MTEYDFGTTPADAPADAPQAPQAPLTVAKEAPVERRQSPLDRLKADARKTVERFVKYEVAGRDGYALEFSTMVESDDVKRYQKNAQGRRKNVNDSDPIIAAAQPLIERNTGIFLDGAAIEGSDGERLLLGDEEWREILEATDAIDAVKKFLGDGQTLSMGGSLYKEAGYGEDLSPVDPQ